MFEEESNNRRKVEQLSVYQKAIEITDLVGKITEIITDEFENFPENMEKKMAERTLQDMIENSYVLPVKISGAEAVELYDLKMENAAIIRKAARELSVACTGLKMLGIEKSVDYLQVLRDEIELFRVEFAEWVKTFDQWDYIIDRWGLFNPPGVNYNDHDPDDDIPFDADSID